MNIPTTHSNDFAALSVAARSHIKEVNFDTLKQKLDEPTLCLIDVREADEYKAGCIPSAKHLSRGVIEIHIHQFANKDQEIYLYCGSGNRSALAAESLQRMGYNKVYSLNGGYKGWVKAGLATILPA